MSLEFVLPMSLEFCVTYVLESFIFLKLLIRIQDFEDFFFLAGFTTEASTVKLLDLSNL
jgi:hypothetical protein